MTFSKGGSERVSEEKKKEGDLHAMQALKGSVLLAICAKGVGKRGKKEAKKEELKKKCHKIQKIVIY